MILRILVGEQSVVANNYWVKMIVLRSPLTQY
jgi:hypothetical protein